MKEEIVEGEYQIIATVTNKTLCTSYTVFQLQDVTAISQSTSKKLSHNITAFYNGVDEEEFSIGMRVVANTYISVNDEFNEINVLENDKYICSLQSGELVFYEKVFNPFNSVREVVYDTLFQNMSKEEASISYALLVGDSSFINHDTLANFRYGGVGHIFAVSGLHIAIVCGAFVFILKKLSVKPITAFFIISVILVLYSGVCNFSPSSLRAVIMCLTFLFSNAFGLKYDKLNSLCMAVFLLLLINPYYVFAVGFQLSVCATAGIILLVPSFRTMFKRLPKKLGDSFAVAFSVQIFTMPVLLDSFGYVALVSVITNLIFIPIISALFMLLLVTTFLAIILPFVAGVIIYLPMYCVKVTKVLVDFVDYSTLLIKGFNIGLFNFSYYSACFIASDKTNLKFIAKSNTVFVLLLITIFGACLI